MSSVKDRIERRIAPTLVVRASRITWPARRAAARRRSRGLQGRVELFFAFDDPCSAIALIDLHERLAGRAVELVLLPVVARGIPGDPAAARKRLFAVADARRLARRQGLVLSRGEPLAAEQTRFLAEWVAAAPQSPALEDFAAAAMRMLWLDSQGPVAAEDFALLWRERLGSAPAPGGGPAVAENQRLMGRRGPYDVPAAWIQGRWFFAHDRLSQIGEWLDELGWRAR